MFGKPRLLSLSYVPLPPDRPDGSAWQEWLRRVGVLRPYGLADERLLQGDPAAVPVLVELLRSPDGQSQMAGAYGLSRVGSAAREAVPDLLTAFEADGSFDAARLAVARIDPDALAAYDRDHQQEERP